MARFAGPPADPVRHLLLVRHGAAAAKAATGGDGDRPLTSEGRAAIAALGARLKAERRRPDFALCSPARRTRETLDLLVAAVGPIVEVAVEEPLYNADVATLLDRLRSVPPEFVCVLLVGHNPGLEELVRTLAHPASAAAPTGLPAGALAIFEVSTTWPALGRAGARLLAVKPP
jgi:phosphohistidine phosphatase